MEHRIQKSHNGRYFHDLSRRNRGVWVISFSAAVGLNLLLFVLMPYLMDPSPTQARVDTLIPRINVIRVKRPEPRVEPKKPVQPPKPREVKVRKQPVAPTRKASPAPTKMSLPFEINPRLPSGPSTLDFPPLASRPLTDLSGLPEVFAEGQLDAPLTAMVRIPPVYPIRARQRGIEGWVRVAYVVTETGHVEEISILEAEPPGLFESSVQRCMGRWRFNPGTVGGMPVRARVETTIRFELEE